MAKVVKIPLIMKNGEKATDMKSLVSNFDVESVLGYFLDGKLEKWLNARYYEEEAEAIAQIDRDDPTIAKQLCNVFGIEYEENEDIDLEAIAIQKERIARLKQFTDDDDVLENVDSVAFDQEELAELYDKGVEKIYLCEGEFRVPKSKQSKTYILVGNPNVEGMIDEKRNNQETETTYIELPISKGNPIPENITNSVRLKEYADTEDYLVYYISIHDLMEDSFYSEEKHFDCFVIYNKITNETKYTQIPNCDCFTKILGTHKNSIILRNGKIIMLYDLDTSNDRVIATSVRDSTDCISYEGINIGYYDKNNNLVVRNTETGKIISIKEREFTNSPFIIDDDRIIYGDGNSNLVMYDLKKHTVIPIITTDIGLVEGMYKYKRNLYLLLWDVWSNSAKLIEFDLDDLTKRPVEIFRSTYGYSRNIDRYNCKFSAPYFVFFKEESDYPLYLFNMETKEIKKIATGCGYSIKGTKYVTKYFNIVGDYLYFVKGDGYNDKNVYRSNLKNDEGNVIVK